MANRCPLGSKGEYRQAAGAFAEAVIRSVKLIVQPDAHDVVDEMRMRADVASNIGKKRWFGG
jgi:hypothetical protein